jgi:hypothetical protein
MPQGVMHLRRRGALRLENKVDLYRQAGFTGIGAVYPRMHRAYADPFMRRAAKMPSRILDIVYID